MNYKKKKGYANQGKIKEEHKRIRAVGIIKPVDGFTPEEEQIAQLLANNTIASLYAKLPTSRMKFIVATHFELGYPQTLVADMLGITQPSLFDEIELIQRIFLGHPYKPRKKKSEVSKEDLFKVMMLLQNQ